MSGFYTGLQRDANATITALEEPPVSFHRWFAEVVRDVAERYGDVATLSWQTLRIVQVPRKLVRELGSEVDRPDGVPLGELLWSAVDLLHINREVDEHLGGRTDRQSVAQAIVTAIDDCFGPEESFEAVELRQVEEQLCDRFSPDLSA